MSARDDLIAHARAQRDEEIDAHIAAIEKLRVLEGFALLRAQTLEFFADDGEGGPAPGGETPGFEQAACTACAMLDGDPDPRDVGRVSLRPTEYEQPGSCRLEVSWKWDRKGPGRYAGTTGTERRVWLDEFERVWETMGALLAERRS